MNPFGLPPKPQATESPMHEAMEGNGVTVSPDAVCYRDEQSICSNCAYMGEDGTCEALNISVEPGAGCNLFKERSL